MRRIESNTAWVNRVHEYYLRTGQAFMVSDAVSRFGMPTTASMPSMLLRLAARRGMFVTEPLEAGGRMGGVAFAYTAQECLPRKPDKKEPSHWEKRVASVFDLGMSPSASHASGGHK